MLRRLDITVAPAPEVVSVEEAKAHIELDDSHWDSFINDLLISARGRVETESGFSLVAKTVAAYYDPSREFKLYAPPVQSITSISTLYEGDETVEDKDKFYLTGDLIPRYRMKREAEWSASRIEEVKIVYVAGHQNANAVPEPLKLAIKQAVADWFEHRGSREIGTVTTGELPGSARMTLQAAGYWIPKI